MFSSSIQNTTVSRIEKTEITVMVKYQLREAFFFPLKAKDERGFSRVDLVAGSRYL
jgi:hypothetical protein